MRDEFDTQIPGQMDMEDMLSPEGGKLIAVSRVFARARKSMSLHEQKTFVYALSQLRFTEEAKSNTIYLDKKKLAQKVGINSDPNHLSVDLYKSIGNLPEHSLIKFADQDRDLYESGVMITRLTMLKNRVRIKFEDDYLSLFTGLSSDYLTLWSDDIFQMTSDRSVTFYEFLRQSTDTRRSINSIGLGVKALKEMFGIPMDAYMREKGGFNRSEFEHKVIDPLCDDLKGCRMINLVVQPDGRVYEKVKRGNRVEGYRFYWTFSLHPGVATAAEVKEIQDRIDKNPRMIKVAEDILKGEKRKRKGEKKNSFTDFPQREDIDYDALILKQFQKKT